MSLWNKRFIRSRFTEKGSKEKKDYFGYWEHDLKESIKRILDKKRKYLPTGEWTVNVDDIKEEFGDALVAGDEGGEE